MATKVKRIRDESEYKSGGGSDFISLDEGEKFLGYALFVGDPKEDETGFFPYKMHWNGKTSVPCADEGCPYCEDGERPRSKAYTLWLVTVDVNGSKLGKDGEGELRIFDMPVTVIKQFNEYRHEDEKILGMPWRISRPDEKTYLVAPKTNTKPLSAKQVKELLKSDEAPDFEQMLTSKLKKANEGIAVARALEDDEDEPRPAKKAKASGKKAKDEEPEEEQDETGEWPDELDEVTVTVQSVEDDGNFFTAVSSEYDDTKDIYTTEKLAKKFDLTDLEEGQEVTVSATMDDDGDYILSANPEVVEASDDPDEEEGEGDNDLPDSLEDVEFVVAATNQAEGTISVKNDEMEFDLYLLDTVKWDEDDYPEGTKIIVSAEKDRAGDMVTTDAPEIVKAKKAGGKSGGKKAAAKKTSGKKGGKGK